MKCRHRLLKVNTEADGCSWVTCIQCPAKGPKKPSYTLALVAWLASRVSQHPRRKENSR